MFGGWINGIANWVAAEQAHKERIRQLTADNLESAKQVAERQRKEAEASWTNLNIYPKENKMTREEAILKITKINIQKSGIMDTETFISFLEALGLIKFDEPKKEEMISWFGHEMGCVRYDPKSNRVTASVEGFNKEIASQGYKLVKIEKN